MADSKITALTELTAPASADLLAIVDDVAGTATTKKVTLQNISDLIAVTEPNNASSIHRQAIINGNFDVWQRGTSFSIVDVTNVFSADRWRDYTDKNGGTLPTLTRTREILTSGDIPNSFYYSRLTTNGAGTSLGTSSSSQFAERIENGTRFLCGDGKKVTVSFYARSSIANKRLTTRFRQYYGTGGSPSATEDIYGSIITLTSTWTKYTYTFTTNTLAGKTFGTNNNDYIDLSFYYMWGTASPVAQSGTAETFGGSGTIDIAQVQLCAGDVALPFMPKSFEEELRACQRYYEKSYDYAIAPGTANDNGEYVYAYNTGTTYKILAPRFKVNKRIAPTFVNIYDRAGTVSKITTLDSSLAPTNNVTITGVDQYSQVGFRIYQNTDAFGVQAHWTVDTEL